MSNFNQLPDKEILTFVKHDSMRLAKQYTESRALMNYLGAKTLTSSVIEVELTKEGLREKHKEMRLKAEQGQAMMKGPFTKPLVKESRRGLSDKDAETQTIVLDFDDIMLPGYALHDKINSEVLELIADQLVAQLPATFHNTSYIATASASMGMKKGKVSMHLDFWLDEKISPRDLKHYLEHLNLTVGFFKERLKLTDKRMSLKYPIDINLAENSRMIYIAPPMFDDKKQNPFLEDRDRIILVPKKYLQVRLKKELEEVRPMWNRNTAKKLYKNLYITETGQNPIRPKLREIMTPGGSLVVQMNPTDAKMTMVADYGDYCTFNVNDGDSAGYYVRKDAPDIVRNFKGEDNFLFSRADMKAYIWFTEKYAPLNGESVGDVKKKSNHDPIIPPGKTPYAYICRQTDCYKYGYLDVKNNELTDIYPTRMKQELENWYLQHGRLMPPMLPYHNEFFDPTDKRTMDLDDHFINLFRPSAILWSKKEIPESAKGATVETASKMKIVAPTIYDLIEHVTCGGEETNAFINWLAALIQKRDKLKTAWVLHGVQGTGKGSLSEGVLKPIFGNAAKAMNITALEEKYNSWLADSVIVMVDEFKNHDASNGGKMNNRLKEYITEPHLPVRMMHRDILNVRNYTNFIFFSNQYDAVYIEDSDRRYNVCPRQELPITVRYPDWVKRYEKQLPKELENFVRFMMEFDVDWHKVNTVINNQAKEDMRGMARRSHEAFAHALKIGDLEYFTVLLQSSYLPGDHTQPARNLVIAWLRNFQERVEEKISNQELRVLYTAMMHKEIGPGAFGQYMARLGLKTEMFSRDNIKMRGIKVVWNMTAEEAKKYAKQASEGNVINIEESLFKKQLSVN